MSPAEAHSIARSPHHPPPGALAFLPPERQRETCATLRSRRYLVADAGGEVPSCGRVRRVIEDAVESALALRGAHPPSVDVLASAEETVRDQLFRARLLGATGVALVLPRLGEAAEGEEHLAFDDSAIIAAWMRAADRDNVSLFFDAGDQDLQLLLPVRLGDRVSTPPREAREPRALREVPPLPEETPAPASEPLLSEVPPSGEMMRAANEVAAPPEPIAAAPITAAPIAAAPIAVELPVLEAPAPEPPQIEISLDPQPSAPAPVVAAPEATAPEAIAPEMAVTEPPAPRAPAPPPPVMAIPRRGVLAKRSLRNAPAPAPEQAPAEPATSLEPQPSAEPAAAQAAPATPVAPAQVAPAEPEPVAVRVVNAAEWRAHALELDKAKGPKPVATIERLFTTRYLPLLAAAARGEVDSSVRSVLDTFRANFEHSYREAYAALRVTGKRPPMVFDVPEIAGKIARLNGARATKLFLVDALRFDLGERVAQMLTERLAGRAVCVERMVLWAAIPTTTPTQMALLSRGAEGLREPGPSSEPVPEITRGRAVATVRRERVGAREVMKLDLVEARIRNAGPGYAERIESLAEEVTEVTLRYIETLPPRTLLFLFGDHGFRLASSADGRATGPASQGGVSPEESLTPGQAWLIGGVH